MTLRLSDLSACFEGVIPSIICTVAADGTPNISYLSHVVRLDEAHVALSNQFFSKTAANIRENPQAALLLVDARNGAQYRLDLRYRETVDSGPIFERMALDLRATSEQIGMADVMRLRGVDIYRVVGLRAVPSPTADPPRQDVTDQLARALAVVEEIADLAELGAIVDTALAALERAFAPAAGMILLQDQARDCLVMLGSRGYGHTGIGAEVPLGQGLIGMAGRERRAVRISDMSRVQRLRAAVEASSEQENRTRSVALPGLPGAMSQIALPMVAQGRLRGVLFLESRQRLAFSAEDEGALMLVARHLAAAIALAETEAAEPAGNAAPMASSTSGAGRVFGVGHHAYDDSVFIDNEYLIKGVPGRLLMHMLEVFLQTGRSDFTNREIRAEEALRLPELKDNLETRLLLLRRRLEEKRAPIRLLRPARGRIRLEVQGRPVITSDRSHPAA